MSQIIAVLNSKGGCGKTSTAIHLAGTLQAMGKSVVVIDADETQGATLWANNGDGLGFNVVPLLMGAKSGRAFRAEIAEAAKDADLIIIDTPPQLSDVARVVAMLADLALVPFSPSSLDGWGAETALDYILDAQDARGGMPKAIAVPSRASKTALAGIIVESLKEREVEMASPITSRVVVAECATVGQTLSQYAPKSDSAKEFEILANLVLERLN